MVERTFARPGDYTAHCIMKDGTDSQSCEFPVCVLEFRAVPENTVAGQLLEIEFRAENIRPIHLSVSSASPPNYAKPVVPHAIWLNDEHRSRGATGSHRFEAPPLDWWVVLHVAAFL